jgi:hypothetical protein
MNGLRRNDDAMKTDAGNKKNTSMTILSGKKGNGFLFVLLMKNNKNLIEEL